MMILFVCILAGAIGTSLAAGLWPERAFSGNTNIALGMIGGTMAWAASSDLAALQPNVANFLTILVIGGACGVMLNMGLAALRNILRD